MRFLLLLLALFPACAMSQADTVVIYKQIVEVPGKTKEQLFSEARQWMNKLFSNYKYTVRIEDKETGEIAGKSAATVPYAWRRKKKILYWSENVDFDFGIYVKDGKYKVEFGPIVGTAEYNILQMKPIYSSLNYPHKRAVFSPSQEALDSQWQDIRLGVNEFFTKLMASLEAQMKSTTSKTDF